MMQNFQFTLVFSRFCLKLCVQTRLLSLTFQQCTASLPKHSYCLLIGNTFMYRSDLMNSCMSLGRHLAGCSATTQHSHFTRLIHNSYHLCRRCPKSWSVRKQRVAPKSWSVRKTKGRPKIMESPKTL